MSFFRHLIHIDKKEQSVQGHTLFKYSYSVEVTSLETDSVVGSCVLIEGSSVVGSCLGTKEIVI